MATPTFTLINHTPINAADASTNWTQFTTADTDIKVEGANAMSGIFRANGTEGYYTATSAPVTAAGKTLRCWFNTTNLPYMQPEASNGYQLLVWDGATTEYKVMFGSDTYPGGWFNDVRDMDSFTTLTLANVRRWGLRANHTGNGKQVINCWADVMRYLDGYSMTGGTSGDKVRLANIASTDKASAYGVTAEYQGVYFATGTIQFGTGATSHYFEMDGQVLIFIEKPVKAGLYKLVGVGSGTNVVIKGSVLRSTGATDATRFGVNFSDSGLAALQFTDNLVVRASTVAFKAGQTVTGNTFVNCGQITHGGANMKDSSISGYEGTAGTAALVYNVAADPDGEIDGSTFTRGTAATHAIELGPNTPSSIVLRGVNFSGYNAANGQNDSVIYNNSGKAITINIVGGSGVVTYRNGAGASTSVVQNPVTMTVAVKDLITGAPIQGARVYVQAGAGGPLAQGTVIINAVTDSNGEVADTRTLASSQPVVGWARKATAPSPFYKTSPIAGTFNSLSGLSLTVQAVRDE